MTLPKKRARRVSLSLAAGLSVLLAACGGGSEPITAYAPQRLLAFGDEMSVLTQIAPQGRKYTVNAVAEDGTTIQCGANTAAQPSLLWTQWLSTYYQFGFEECNPDNQPVRAFTFARPGAKVEDFAVQLLEARARFGPLDCNNLVSVLIGANDVLELYPLYLANPTTDTGNQITNTLKERAIRLANALNALTAPGGAKVLLSTIPLMDLTPFALQQAREHPTLQIGTWMRTWSNAFNSAMRTTMINDGTRWGLVELDSMIGAGVSSPSTYGLTNITAAACAVNTPDCNNTPVGLVTGANPTTWLWASDLWIGWRAHQYLGGYARGRVANNPFGCS